jgi:hypothetical protein
MQRKRKSALAKGLLSMTAAIAILLVGIGCPNSVTDGEGEGEGKYTPQTTLPPEKPSITGSQIGFELVNVDLKNFAGTMPLPEDQESAVISLSWTGQGATSYNLYWNTENSRPITAGLTGVTGTGAFARNLQPETTYYLWVEAVNPNGTAVSDFYERTTGKKGSNGDGGVERGDYPRGGRFNVVPGNGSLTVTWDLFDRVGWYEVYYAPVGTIKHVDIYTPVEFRYDSAVALRPGAIDISSDPAAPTNKLAYKEQGALGHTRPLYPFLTPLAANSGWEGYYIRDGKNRVDSDTRPIIGVDDLEAGTFYKIMEIYDRDLSEPYKALDSAFVNAIPWDGKQAGAAGTPIKFFGTSTTITGLTNGTAYEVWLRCPNANGERGYGYVVGTPGGGSTLSAPSNVKVSTPADTVRHLAVSWNQVSGADGYRIYADKYDYTPSAGAEYTAVSGGDTTSYTLNTLDPNTNYYVWVVAEKNGVAGTFGAPVSGKTGVAPATGKSGIKTIADTNANVKTAVYIEVNDDNPLNAGSYVLEDGTYLFDYVILFAANIRNRNRVNEDSGTEAAYLHLNENVQHILNNRNKYIKPLQDKGIKVLLGLLGDHDGITFSNLTDSDRAAFVADVAQVVNTYQLDGVDFDDEWGSKEDWDNWGVKNTSVNPPTNTYENISPDSIWTYPVTTWGYPTSTIVYRNPTMGIVAGNGQFSAPSENEMNVMWQESGENYYKTIVATRAALGTNKIVSLYEYNTGRYITKGGVANTTATTTGLADAIDFAMQPWYNQYIADSANGLSNSIYSPFGMDLSGEAYAAQNGAPNPPIVKSNNERATDTIHDYATRFKATAAGGNPYNVLYFYGLEKAEDLLKHDSSDSTARVTKEEYISMMTEIVFGQKCILTTEGGNYPKDW